MKRITLVCAVALLVTACGTPPQKLSRSEWRDMTTRTYPGVNKEALLENIEYLFELADRKDVTITHYENGLTANRSVFVYAIIAAVSGHYRWDVKVIETDEGTTATTYVYANLNGHTAVVTGPNSVAPYTDSSNSGNALQSKEGYDLFWSRLDYLTGKSDKWISCEEMAELTNTSAMGALEALCINADDESPEGEKIAQENHSN